MFISKNIRGLFPLFLCFATLSCLLPAQISAQESSGKDIVLGAKSISTKIFPGAVFYRGQVAPVQMRNTGGIHFADGKYVLAGLVDNSGYSSGIQQKYQGYFISEVTLLINGQSLKPGAYGIGFVKGSKFFVTDLGANTVLEISGKHDTEIHHPIPLQVIAGSEKGQYRLYLGRDFVELHRAD
jgi:hypothetical protein